MGRLCLEMLNSLISKVRSCDGNGPEIVSAAFFIIFASAIAAAAVVAVLVRMYHFAGLRCKRRHDIGPAVLRVMMDVQSRQRDQIPHDEGSACNEFTGGGAKGP